MQRTLGGRPRKQTCRIVYNEGILGKSIEKCTLHYALSYVDSQGRGGVGMAGISNLLGTACRPSRISFDISIVDYLPASRMLGRDLVGAFTLVRGRFIHGIRGYIEII